MLVNELGIILKLKSLLVGELAPAISATVNIRGNAVDFLVVHMGNDG